MQKKLLVAIYGHPESYPPTLNALTCLANDFKVKVIHRAHQPSGWAYPKAVELIPDGAVLSAQAQENLSIWRKVLVFLRFVWVFSQNYRHFKPEVILLYDSLSILAYCLVPKLGLRKTILWYHNHDILDPTLISKYSLSWWALRAEKSIFPKLNIFTLPALERKIYFPINFLQGQFFFLPNYPSISFYQQFHSIKQPINEIRLLFQGQVGPGHGIEEIISMLPLRINGMYLKLVLKGSFRAGYDQWIQQQIVAKKLTSHIELHGFTPYAEVPRLGSQCHIGLAVFTKVDIMNQSLGTASNKIYEYAALGLPILYYDSPHFNQHLQQYSWAIKTNLSNSSIEAALSHIVTNYESLAAAAHNDFLKQLNFEYYFTALNKYFSSQLSITYN